MARFGEILQDSLGGFYNALEGSIVVLRMVRSKFRYLGSFRRNSRL